MPATTRRFQAPCDCELYGRSGDLAVKFDEKIDIIHIRTRDKRAHSDNPVERGGESQLKRTLRVLLCRGKTPYQFADVARSLLKKVLFEVISPRK